MAGGRVGFGLIGYGAWGRHHAEALEQAADAELLAIACHREETAAEARQRHPKATVFLDYRDLLRHPGVAAVDIVLPNHLHHEVGCASLEAGKHVLLEKPMATSIADCDALIAAATRTGRLLAIAHEFRLSTQWGRIKALIDEGAIGQPQYLSINLFRFPYRQGAEGWRYDKRRVGSWILEEPVHFYDLALWYFASLGLPTSVLGFGNAQGIDGALSPNFSSVVKFPGGAYALITQTLAGFEFHQVVEVVGREGAVRTWWSGAMDRTRNPSFELKLKRTGRTEFETIPIGASGEAFELEALVAKAAGAFRAGSIAVPGLVSGEEGRRPIVLCLEAERSLGSGQEIRLAF
ncbi:MAG: Gfo/Idh/MocA family oxidoreductase [Alphaproteobacteria bacterium]|nr:Gfo/Idh/MocA family oxidoreductase [Alphaproteobacteria bacterium]